MLDLKLYLSLFIFCGSHLSTFLSVTYAGEEIKVFVRNQYAEKP